MSNKEIKYFYNQKNARKAFSNYDSVSNRINTESFKITEEFNEGYDAVELKNLKKRINNCCNNIITECSKYQKETNEIKLYKIFK